MFFVSEEDLIDIALKALIRIGSEYGGSVKMFLPDYFKYRYKDKELGFYIPSLCLDEQAELYNNEEELEDYFYCHFLMYIISHLFYVKGTADKLNEIGGIMDKDLKKAIFELKLYMNSVIKYEEADMYF